MINQNKMTAVEWVLDWMDKNQYFIGNDLLQAVKKAKEMEKEQKIEFAKLHVDAALRAVEAKIIVKGYAGSIMNSYPLENIE